MLRDRLGLDLGRGLALEHRLGGQLRVGRAGTAGSEDDAVLDAQRGSGHTELRAGGLDEDAARFGAGEPQGRSGFFDGTAPRGDAFVGSARSIPGNHLDARQVDLQLVGDDLGERGHDPLADLHLAGEGRHRAVGVDAQPAVEQAVLLQAPGKGLGSLGEPASEGRESEAYGERGGLLEETTPRDASAGPGAHGDISFAARWTARTIRLCVPQRQRFPASASRISASVGCGF